MLSVKLKVGVNPVVVSDCERLLACVELSDLQLVSFVRLLSVKSVKSAGRPLKSKKVVEVGGDLDVFSQLLSMGLADLSLIGNEKVVLDKVKKGSKLAKSKAVRRVVLEIED